MFLQLFVCWVLMFGCSLQASNTDNKSAIFIFDCNSQSGEKSNNSFSKSEEFKKLFNGVIARLDPEMLRNLNTDHAFVQAVQAYDARRVSEIIDIRTKQQKSL